MSRSHASRHEFLHSDGLAPPKVGHVLFVLVAGGDIGANTSEKLGVLGCTPHKGWTNVCI